MRYDHTQRAPLHLLLDVPAAACFAMAWLLRDQPPAPLFLLPTAGLFLLLAYMFRYLRIFDEGQSLVVRYGPIPLFGTRIPYHKITQVAADRTRFIDGWGIHWVPGRGTTFNLWGFDCVRIEMGSKTVRLGTDDPDGLCEFIREQVAPQGD